MTMKRLTAPKHWKIERKTKKYVMTPLPGPFSKKKCIPLGVVLRDNLGLAQNSKEIKQILNSNSVRVNNKTIKESRFPVGVMDILSIGSNSYIVFPSSYGLSLFLTSTSSKKLLLIKNKKVLNKNKIQLNFHDGSNMISDKDCKTHDVVVFDLSQKKIDDVIPFKKGSFAVVIDGKNVGKIGSIENIEDEKVAMKIDNETISIPKKYVLVIGKDNPAINIGEKA